MRHVKKNSGFALYQMKHKSNVRKPIILLFPFLPNILTLSNDGVMKMSSLDLKHE